ncbi:ketopantoate reductase family protein [Pontibacter sp. JAM-7]|uniref:ketopantoate reductase family protein n=1 Tax=Pontibacter sp. JAM-7 TaxID=3366581 RepID=UPI003AF89E04
MNSHWYILGAGAIGCQWAAALLKGGSRVSLIVRSPERLAQLEHNGGITIESKQGTAHYPVAGRLAADCPTIGHLLVATKAYDALPAIKRLHGQLSATAQIILIQNGMGSQQAIQTLLPEHPIIAATTTNGAWLRKPFHVVLAGTGNTQLGLLNPAGQPQPKLPATPGLDISWDLYIDQALWRKLAINCAINPLTAVHGCQNGQLVSTPALHTELAQVCHEVDQLLAGEGLQLFSSGLLPVAEQIARQTGDNYSSMLQDIRQGRQSEIDYITGYLLQRAAALQMSLPINQALYSAVTQLDQTSG